MTKNIYTVIKILTIGAIIFMGVDTFYRIFEAGLEQPDFEIASNTSKPGQSKRQIAQKLNDYEIIDSRSIFGKTGEGQVNPEEDLSKVESLQQTSLDLILLGTVAGSNEYDYAVITDKSKQSQDIYMVGDSVKNAVIKNILRGRVVLTVNGKDEILLMDEASTQTGDMPATQGARISDAQIQNIPSRTITIQRSEIEESLSNIQELLSQASIKPHFSNGEADGLAITGVQANSIFRKMGFRNGDIIKGVKGNEIKSPEDLISLYNNLQNDEAVEIQIIRRGIERTINYRFK